MPVRPVPTGEVAPLRTRGAGARAMLLPLRVCAAARPVSRESACVRPAAGAHASTSSGGSERKRGRHCARALYDSGEADTVEKDDLVSSAFKERVASASERSASAASTGSSDKELAARIASGEFSNSNPLVEALKPLRKWLAQLPGPGACLPPRSRRCEAAEPIKLAALLGEGGRPAAGRRRNAVAAPPPQREGLFGAACTLSGAATQQLDRKRLTLRPTLRPAPQAELWRSRWPSSPAPSCARCPRRRATFERSSDR